MLCQGLVRDANLHLSFTIDLQDSPRWKRNLLKDFLCKFFHVGGQTNRYRKTGFENTRPTNTGWAEKYETIQFFQPQAQETDCMNIITMILSVADPGFPVGGHGPI